MHLEVHGGGVGNLNWDYVNSNRVD